MASIKHLEGAWSFTQPLTERCEIACPDPECGVFSPVADWHEGYVDCETCGDQAHDAIGCPVCGEPYSHLDWITFAVRERQEEAP